MRASLEALAAMNRWRKRTTMMFYDGAAMFAALWLAFSLRLDQPYWPNDPLVFLLAAGSVAGGLVGCLLVGAYRIVIRYLDVQASARLALGAAIAAASWMILAYFVRVDTMPRSVGFIYPGLLFLFMFFGRLVASQILISWGSGAGGSVDEPGQTRVAVYGASPAGLSLGTSLLTGRDYKLCFFVDDSPDLVGRTLLGRPVIHPAALAREIPARRVEKVFLALPSASRSERLAALGHLSGLGVGIMTIPSHEEMMEGRYGISDVRPINVEDLLKRDVVPPLPRLIDQGSGAPR